MLGMDYSLPQRPDGTTEFEMSVADFDALSDLAFQLFGLDMPRNKKALVYARLVRRLRHLGLGDFAAYRDYLSGPDGPEEQRKMLSALTTNVTHFFRERHHFELLETTILPPLLDAAKSGQRLRFWSAGCSSGQEAYCLSAVILKLFPEAANFDVRVLATDIDPDILTQARDAVFPQGELQSIPEELRPLMVKETSQDNGTFSIASAVRRLVSFGEINLINPWPMQGQFDVIICRNVAIYFDAQTQQRLWDRLQSLLTADGCLLIGHSERLAGPAAARMEMIGVTAFQNTKPRGRGAQMSNEEKDR